MIDSFTGDYQFLSNFHPHPLTYEGVTYPTAEHAYQAQKTLHPSERTMIAKLRTPGLAKKAGKLLVLRPDWERVKVQVMREILTEKFKHYHLRKQLSYTAGQTIVEGNYWHDNYWGMCRCERCANTVSENHLGKLLMEIRGDGRV